MGFFSIKRLRPFAIERSRQLGFHVGDRVWVWGGVWPYWGIIDTIYDVKPYRACLVRSDGGMFDHARMCEVYHNPEEFYELGGSDWGGRSVPRASRRQVLRWNGGVTTLAQARRWSL